MRPEISIHSAFFSLVATTVLLSVGCDQMSVEPNPGDGQPANQALPDQEGGTEDYIGDEERVPASLDEALDLMMTGLTDEHRKFIEDAGDDYATYAHFGGGMGMRNSWGLWGDSPLTRYFSRLGIYHADDMSAIINEAFSRRVRGKPVELEELVKYYRNYWEELDIIAPLDLECPSCGKEMVIRHEGDGVSEAHPERVYFSGTCPDGHEFLFHHQSGWKDSEAIKGEGVGGQ